MSKRMLARSCALAGAAGLALTLAACGGSSSPAADGAGPTTTATVVRSRSLDTGFESGTTEGLTDSGNAEVTHGAAKTGSYGFDVDARASNGYGRWDAEPDGVKRPYWSFRAWVRIVSWTPNESVDLFTVQNLEAKNNFDLFISAPSRAFQWDLFRENSGRSQGEVELARWYLVEARGSFASETSTADVRIDGVDQPSIASPGQPPSAVKEFVLGSVGTAKTKHAQFDDVRVEVADEPIAFFGP